MGERVKYGEDFTLSQTKMTLRLVNKELDTITHMVGEESKERTSAKRGKMVRIKVYMCNKGHPFEGTQGKVHGSYKRGKLNKDRNNMKNGPSNIQITFQ